MAEVTDNEAFSQLRAELVRAGCFDYRPGAAVASLLVHLAASAGLFVVAARLPWFAAIPLFVFASFLFYRLGWLMHDAAHGGVFGRPAADRRFAALCAGILGEFPSGWKYGHNRHHAFTNVRGRDGDQAQRFDPTRRYRSLPGAFFGLFFFSRFRHLPLPNTLLLLGIRDAVYCFKTARKNFRAELLAVLASFLVQVAFFLWLFGWAGLFAFYAHTAIGMMYLNAAFAGNHYDLPVFAEAEADRLSFAALQLRTTRNYTGGWWARYVFGGLEHQIEHHLFPAMPRTGFLRAEPIVRAWAVSHGLPYEALPFGECMLRVMRYHLDAPAPAAEPAR